MPSRVPLAVLLFAVSPLPILAAEGDWPPDIKSAYVNNSCAPALVTQGMAPEAAKEFCQCMIDAQELEFGWAEFDSMMAAQPNPDGTDIERRLYNTIAGCSPKQ